MSEKKHRQLNRLKLHWLKHLFLNKHEQKWYDEHGYPTELGGFHRFQKTSYTEDWFYILPSGNLT